MHDITNNLATQNILRVFTSYSTLLIKYTLITDYRSFSKGDYEIKFSRLDKQGKPFFFRLVAKIWNYKPSSIRKLQKHSFKKKTRDCFNTSNPFTDRLLSCNIFTIVRNSPPYYLCNRLLIVYLYILHFS